MTAFESMSEKLAKTGLYSTSEGNLVYAELMAYAEGLDIYYNVLDELLRECFVATAESYGLTMREEFLRKCNVYDSIEGRRKSIIAALSICNTDYTMEGFEKCLDIFGIEGTLTEDAENRLFTFDCTTAIPENKLELIKEQLSQFFVPNFDFEFNIESDT